MAIIFDATIGGNSSNSYSSIADYNQYRENLGLTVLDDAVAQVQLIKGTSWLENNYRCSWNTNSKTNSEQKLHFPQSGAYYADGTLIPDDIIPSQVLEALYQYCIKSGTSTSLDPVQATNLKIQKLDGLGEQEFFGKNSDGSLPDDFKFLDTILCGLITNRSGGMRILTMERL